MHLGVGEGFWHFQIKGVGGGVGDVVIENGFIDYRTGADAQQAMGGRKYLRGLYRDAKLRQGGFLAINGVECKGHPWRQPVHAP